ncbi:G protein-coupled receptor kinase 6-like [Menidia menidia]
MDIDSMVQNSALVRAREGGGSKGRSWRWREMLRFPPVSQCQELASIIERDYYSLCVVQPIGRELFRLFCRSRPDLKNHTKLLEALEEFDTKADEERMEFGVSIIQRFLQPEGVAPLAPLQQSSSLSLQLQPCTDVFQPCREELHRVLSGEPFSHYQNTVFFHRFLQWKMLERQPVTKQNFRQYRLLGKGGFGEVPRVLGWSPGGTRNSLWTEGSGLESPGSGF